jgi:phage/plasmid-associated DNA primase
MNDNESDIEMDEDNQENNGQENYDNLDVLDEDDLIRLFKEFMVKHKMEKTNKGTYPKEITHTCLGPPYGTYHIPDKDYDRFINLYKRILPYTQNNLHVIERHKIYGPVLIDIDFKIANNEDNENNKERQYLDKHIQKVIEYILKIMTTYLEINKEDIEAFVFEKEEPTYEEAKKTYKDGFHIVFPGSFHVGIRYFILEELKTAAEKDNIFEDIPFTNELSDVFDKSVVMQNGWCLYGSRKIKGQLYNLTAIYDINMEQKSLDTYEQDELVSKLCIRQYDEDETVKLKDKYEKTDIRKKINAMCENNGKTINDKIKNNNLQTDNPDGEVKLSKTVAEKMERYTSKAIPKNKQEDVSMAKKLVELLSSNRAGPYKEWRDVGLALHSVDASLLPEFLKFSKRAKNYNEKGCVDFWTTLDATAAKNPDERKGFTIASLFWWARNDSPAAYSEILRLSINQRIREAETGTHDDIALVAYDMYKHIFKCVSIKKNIWYEFQSNRWVLIDSAYTLANKLSDELTVEFASLTCTYMRLAGDYTKSGEKEEAELAHSKGIKMSKIIEKLKNDSFKNSVISACAKRFYDVHFEEGLDDNKDVIGFENGVYDLRVNSFGFRPGVPEDCITMSVGYNYIDYKETDTAIKEVMEYFRITQSEDDMREYVLLLLASFLDGHNRNQKFVLWTGSGCHAENTKIIMHNGKVKKVQDIELDDQVMGDDGRPRRVKVLFKGSEDLFDVYLDDGDKMTFNGKHRMPFRNHFNKNIYKGTDIYDQEVYYVEWYEYIDKIPIKYQQCFKTEQEAYECLKHMTESNCDLIKYGESIPIMIQDYKDLQESVKQDFKLFHTNLKLDKTYTSNTRVDTYQNAMKLGCVGAGRFVRSNFLKRLDYVAGLIDKFGNYDKNTNRFVLPYNIFNRQHIGYIIRSLGYRVDIDVENNKIYLSGHTLFEIPTRVVERAIREDKTKLDFDYAIKKLEKIGKGMFYGFELDGNKRYMLDNMIVSMNSNGKSTTVDLMQYTMGDYFGILPTTVITVKHKNSSGARPELANKRGKRFLVIQEPEHDDVVYVGQMKNLTGSDWIETRALYGDPFSFKPQFKLVLICNKLPFIPANDGGTWRRLRVTPWEAEFVDKPDPKKPKQHKKDPELMERLKEWRQPMAWILLNKYYIKYKTKGIPEPLKVTQYTDKYKKDSDIFYEYMKDNYEVTKSKLDRETLQGIYEGFKNWYKQVYNNNVPPRRELECYLQTLDGVSFKAGFVTGIKVVFQSEKEQEDEE